MLSVSSRLKQILSNYDRTLHVSVRRVFKLLWQVTAAVLVVEAFGGTSGEFKVSGVVFFWYIALEVGS